MRHSGMPWSHKERRARDDRYILSQELPVAEGYAPRSVHPNDVLVELTDFYYNSGFVPFSRMWARLVLDAHAVTNNQRWECSCVL